MSFKAITQLHQFPLLLHSQQVQWFVGKLHSERAVVPDVFEIFHLLWNQEVDIAEPYLSSVAEQRQRGRDCGMLCEFATVWEHTRLGLPGSHTLGTPGYQALTEQGLFTIYRSTAKPACL